MKARLGLILAGMVLMISGAVHAAENLQLRASVLQMKQCYTDSGVIQFFSSGRAIYTTESGPGAYGSYRGAYGRRGTSGLRTRWTTDGNSVYLLVDGQWSSVTIGFRSKTCTLN